MAPPPAEANAPQTGRPNWWAVVLLAAMCLAAWSARAADDVPWRPPTDQVFRPVAQNADFPNALIPLAITEGPDGFLWLGGDEGLLRWDGYEFRLYRAQPTLPHGVRDTTIRALHQDTKHRLWIGTSAGGLARYDPLEDRLFCVPLEGPNCGDQHVDGIADDGAGGLWISTTSGLFRLDADGKPLAQSSHITDRPKSLPSDEVVTSLVDAEGVLWVGTHGGLVRSTDNGRSFIPVPLDHAPPCCASHLMEDSAHRIWIGTRQAGAYVIGADRGPAQPIPGTGPEKPNETATEINAVLEVSPGRIWLATYGAGIVEVDAATLHTQRIRHDPYILNGLDTDSVESLYKDRSGLVWIGTEGGLSQYNPDGLGLMTMFGHKGRKDGLPGESAEALYTAPDGSLWAGMQGEGYVRLDAAGHRTGGLDGRRVFAFTASPNGGVLVGTDSGLFLADASGRHTTPLQIPQLPPTVDVRTMRLIDGAVWLGIRDGGLFVLRIDARNHVSVMHHEVAPALTNSTVDTFVEMPNGNVAVGTDNGVNFVDPEFGEIERIAPNPADTRGLDEGLVGCLLIDRKGRLWVGTQNGLDIMQGRDVTGRPVFRHLGAADGLPSASIDGLALDRKGRVWAATDMGLAVIDPGTFAVKALQRADGLALGNYWADAVAVLPGGDIVFGAIGGMTIVGADAAPHWDYKAPVVITAAQAGGVRVPVAQLADAPLVVPAADNSLSVEFAALDFSAPAKNRYRYMLEGFDNGWIETDAAHRVASYTNLPPGDYRMRLRGSNREGQITLPETTLQIRVLPAWFQTMWFRAAAVLAGMLLLAAVLSAWTAIARRRQRELQRQVNDRTAELSVSKLQLQHANAVLERRVEERTHTLEERTSALEASEARFRAWFNNAEDAVFVVQVDTEGRFTFEAVNAAVERVYGIPIADFLGRRPEAVLPADYAAGVLERYREAAKGDPIQFETRFPGPSGDRLLDTWIVPLRNPVTQRVERLVGASRDMTERRALESRLAQAQKLQALGGLAGGIAHDFNNILQAVAGAAMLIEQRLNDREKVQRLARATFAAAERGTSITRRLLAFARSDELRVESMPAEPVLEGLAEVLTYTLGTTIHVRTKFAPDLPRLLADRGQLETALVNLGTNARDAMPGGGTLTLSATADTVQDGAAHPASLEPGIYVRIDVTDTGTGMDEATLERAVEPFFTTKPQGQGTGLGLALVKGFAEQSGGGMAIQSAPGAGTTVSIWLRQADPDAKPLPLSPPSTGPLTATFARILVVDDDDMVRETLADQLEGAGFSVVAAASGAEALTEIQTSRVPDAMVCDLSMPGMNGIETIQHARELVPGLPCFLLTGYAGERAALETGDNFTLLRKPISASALIAQIEAGLASKRRCDVN